MKQDAKKKLRVFLFIGLFTFILIYIFLGSRSLIFGVKIKNVNIENNTTLYQNIQNITGNAKNAIFLSLNDREITIDQEGNFNETISLFLGYNKLTIKAEDKFGNKDEKNYQLIYKNI